MQTNLVWKEANGKYDYESQNNFRDLFSAFELSKVSIVLSDRILRAFDQMSGDQSVKRGNHYKRDRVVEQKLEKHNYLRIPFAQLFGKGIANEYRFVVSDQHFPHERVVGARNSNHYRQRPDYYVDRDCLVLVGYELHRLNDGRIALSTKHGQREHSHPNRYVTTELTQFAHKQAVRPALKRVDCADEGQRHQNDSQVADRQTDDVGVGHRSHRLVPEEYVDYGAVANQTHDENYNEDSWNQVRLQPVLVGNVCLIGLIIKTFESVESIECHIEGQIVLHFNRRHSHHILII